MSSMTKTPWSAASALGKPGVEAAAGAASCEGSGASLVVEVSEDWLGEFLARCFLLLQRFFFLRRTFLPPGEDERW